MIPFFKDELRYGLVGSELSVAGVSRGRRGIEKERR